MAAPSIPTLEIEDPAGRRVVVAPTSADDRLGDLADALGVDTHLPLRIDGRTVTRRDTLAAAGVRRGSRLHATATPAALRAGSSTGGTGTRNWAGIVPESGTIPAQIAGWDDSRPDWGVGGSDGGDHSPALVVAVCDAGPSAGAAITLGAGRHVVGRAAGAHVAIADPQLEPHHAILDVDQHGHVSLIQLTGRVPCRVDGQPVADRAVVPDGATLVLGASRLRVGRAIGPAPGGATVAATPGDPWRRTLRRTPRVVPRWDPAPIPVAEGGTSTLRPSAAGVIAALFTATGSIAVAVLMGSPMLLVFGGVAVLAAVGMWVVGRVGSARDGRRRRAGRDRAVAAFAAAVHEQREARWRHHLATTPGVAEALAAASSLRADVWSRRPDHPDVHRVTVGWGQVDWDVALADAGRGLLPELAGIVAAASHFDDAAVPAALGPGAAVALAGPSADAVARALVVQLATWVGPADVRIVAVVDDPDAWDWCRWLPHAVVDGLAAVIAADAAEDVAAVLAAADDGSGRHIVVVTDRAELLAQRTGALRRFLGGAAATVAVIAVVDPGGTPPAMCRSVLEIGSIGLARWWADASVDAHPVTVHAAGVTVADAASVARRLAGLHDPEDASAPLAPAVSVGIGALHERLGPGPIDDAIAIAAAWRSAGADAPPVAIVGTTPDGVVELDLVRDGPHALVAGTTGSGKSELLRTLVASIAARCSPDHVTFVLVDYKGGSTFDACAELPHTVGVVTDLDERLAERALVSLEAELRRRERILRDARAVDLTAYRAQVGRPPMPRLVVVIDEFAALAAELPGFLDALVGVAQRGRSLGVHLILATQRPAGVVSDDVRANTNLRIALRVHDVADGRDVVGDDGPASFPRRAPGRAMVRLGPGEHVVFQVARCTGPAARGREERLHVVDGGAPAGGGDEAELTVLVRSIRNAAALSDVAPPNRPWLPPLAERLSGVELPAGAVGLVDLPSEQCQLPLAWTPADGNLALLGALGSGTTSALAAVVLANARSRPPSSCHVYVIDARGDHRLDDLASLTHCAGVVRPHERERLVRLLRRLAADIDARRAGGGGGNRPDVIVAIDGAGALRVVLDNPLDSAAYELLQRIVTEGAAVGVATVLTAERPGGVPPAQLAACAERWVFHLDDPAEGPLVGVPSPRVPPAVPGRLVVASRRLEAQIADVGDLGAPVAAAGAASGARVPGGPPSIGELPAHVDAATLPPRSSAAGELDLVVGCDYETLGPAHLVVPDGEHVLVLGPARSGRTTALARLAASWRAAHPDGFGRVVAPRCRGTWPPDFEIVDVDAAVAAVDAQPARRPALLVVDDAERVDDASGALARLIAERRAGVLVTAAGRPDTLRVAYGHWTATVRRSRIGVLLSACADVDGDLLGELLPRHPPLPPRPGLAWLVDSGPRRLAQLAVDPAPSEYLAASEYAPRAGPASRTRMD